MMDGRRHSVDIPISKTLLALRRVRSLRDPSTNSLSKFSSLVDNLNWETNSSNGITLGFVNGCEDGRIVNNNTSGSKDLDLYGQKEENLSDFELYHRLRKSNSKFNFCESKQVVGSDCCRSRQETVSGDKFLIERYCGDGKDYGMDLTCITPSSDHLEGVGSCNEPVEGSFQADHNRSKQKTRYKKKIRSSRGAAGDVVSRVGSPCLSMSDALLEGSNRGTSLYRNEDVDVIDHNHLGCGISCCWSRTPRFRESNLPSDVEGQPLLSGQVGETLIPGQGKNWKLEIIPYSESPRSFSQKFRPKSFNELVGQNVVARSLLSAISNGRVTSFYLFHGPRGTGKTSASRIFAAALNCLSLDEHRPCGLCQECLLFFAGRSRDIKEVDSVRINRTERVRSLVKNAAIPPVSSRFKIFIIDECHLLRGETWVTFLNNMDGFSQHVIFVMITPDLEKLPRNAVSRSQRYHFPKIKEADVASRLGKICIEEGLDFDQGALEFIAARSNGSLRDAEMMLEQLSLLGKKITMSMAYELIGIVSEDELLDLLDLAFSSDTSNTIRRARELMQSRIDPMQLISQLANLIMDILAGKCQEGTSEVRRKFFGRHTLAEADVQQLSHALKILSETEKQLRTSKNQTTWLTVALLQLSSAGSSFLDANDSRLCVRTVHPRDGDFCSTSSTGESLKHLVTCMHDNNDSCRQGMKGDKENLESIWRRATEICKSNSVKKFLRKQGMLSSVQFNHGLAVAELEFHRSDFVSKAEKSWKLIANALQSILGCNVEIRINLVHCASVTKYTKVKRPSFRLFNCSRRMPHDSLTTTERGSNPSDKSDFTSEKALIRDNSVEACSSDCAYQISQNCNCRKAAAKTIRNSEGNALSIGATESPILQSDDFLKHRLAFDSSKEEGSNYGCPAISAQVPEKQPSCFPRTLMLHKKSHSSDTSQMICLKIQPQNNLEPSIPGKTSETYFHANDHNPYIFCSRSNNYNNCSGDEVVSRMDSKVHCWNTPTFPFKKAWQMRHLPQRSHLV